ncbi:MAG TPA: amidohydrolase/deacetylase family metallohydrolase [Chloroflexota bacterium]|nr:amidohydrolase/deacetylase family metallohydrolase [Chloroflexota bacterium]
MANYDLLLAGGTVLDPASGRNGRFDVAIRDGRIAAVEPSVAAERAARVLDVRGCYVTPGLIDFHVHSYWGVNPYGFNADPICTRSGVTTAVDAGSAGCINFLGFKRFIAAPARTRMLAFVCLAQHGVLQNPKELRHLEFADPEGAARTVREHPDVAVGIKVRLDEPSVLENGREALRLALQAGEASGTPIMVHIGHTRLSIEEIADTLRPGDIITHCFTPLEPSIVDEQGRLRPAVRAAHERGVIFDVGHANRHFTFEIVRACLAQGLAPDVISTDLHAFSPGGPVVDMPTTLTKLLALGMPLEQVIAAATVAPARAIGWDDRLGSLAVGREADVAVLELVDAPLTLRDCAGQTLEAPRHLRARHTIRGGEIVNEAEAVG